MIQFSWGDLQLTVLDGGAIWLDGGAMFGVVPKPLWSKLRPADERNRIRLALNLLLVDDGKRRTLVDSGAGDKWDDRARAIYGFETPTAEEIVRPAGIAPGDVDRVINTHLHFDHAGGNTTRDPRGAIVPVFPNAEVVVQSGELETARWSNERTRGSYVADDFEPLVTEGRLRTIEGDVALDDHIRVTVAPGHTPHMQIVQVLSRQGTLAFMADLVPTASHVAYPYIMGFDLQPLVTLESKKRILPRAAAEGWWLVLEHDDRMPLARLVESGGKLEPRALEVT